jgi:chromosome partitioning protein
MPSRKRFLAVAHLKGGSGATTATVNLAAELAARRLRVLLIDCDPVAASTFYLLAETPQLTLADVLDGRAAIADVILETPQPRLAIVPSGPDLAGWDRRPERFPEALARALGAVPPGVSVALLDLPPSAGAIVRGALSVVPGGAILAPVQARALDLVGFNDLVALVEELRERNPELHLAGVIPTRTNKSALCRDVLDALRQAHRGIVLPGIRDSGAVVRSPLRRLPLRLAYPRASAGEDFRALARAVVSKVL